MERDENDRLLTGKKQATAVGEATRFKPGQSGNPNGRPKVAAEIREIARRHGPEAFQRVVELLRSEDERVSFVAAQEILNRAYGKPIQQAEVRVEHDIVDLSDADLAAIATASSRRTIEAEESPPISH